MHLRFLDAASRPLGAALPDGEELLAAWHRGGAVRNELLHDVR